MGWSVTKGKLRTMALDGEHMAYDYAGRSHVDAEALTEKSTPILAIHDCEASVGVYHETNLAEGGHHVVGEYTSVVLHRSIDAERFGLASMRLDQEKRVVVAAYIKAKAWAKYELLAQTALAHHGEIQFKFGIDGPLTSETHRAFFAGEINNNAIVCDLLAIYIHF
ncbi:MAG: hypothetical protein B7X31_11550 [Thiomonas sp. 13-66-29]|jgi:hypothetical protein|uniref:Uncharacterized protein n=1 Tax=Thiomonas delicata TaxID=364030 RepID=A0A238D915_THIDL|nr:MULTISPECIES: hypothetical protein [Thiomonas]OZB60603.1 MAG: hypothetical protein B7X31_11550 [Thiomonas sp. 13-66-29]SBP89624.1 hypothetical protein THIARS_80148 [Thiomonas delicata]